jgi:hypothetical protein
VRGAGGPEVPDIAAPAFMRHVLLGEPALPQVTEFQVSDDGRRYSWKASGPRESTRAVLNWSPAKAVSLARYWMEFPATRESDTWSAEVPAEFAPLAAQAFVNVGDECPFGNGCDTSVIGYNDFYVWVPKQTDSAQHRELF